jgi:hypothetical protein
MNLFSSKPSAVLYLRRQDAVLISKGASARLTIPIEVAYNLEVRDAATLSDIVAQFLEEHKVQGQQLLIVLDSTIVFQKQLSAGTDTQTARTEFASKLPFEPETKQLIEVHRKDQATFYGVNKTWYEAVAAGIKRANKLKAVVPAFAYGFHEDQKVDQQTVTTLFQNTQPLREANFLLKA